MESTSPSCSSTFCLENSLKLQICYAHSWLYGKKIHQEYGSCHPSRPHIEYADPGEKTYLYVAKIGLELLQRPKNTPLPPPIQLMETRGSFARLESEDFSHSPSSSPVDELLLSATPPKNSFPPPRQIMQERAPFPVGRSLNIHSEEEDLLSLVHLRQSAIVRRLATCISSYVCCHLFPLYRTIGWGIQPMLCCTVCCSIACETGHDLRDSTGEFVDTFYCDQPPRGTLDLTRRIFSPCWLFCCSCHSNRHFLLPRERDLYGELIKKNEPVDDWISKIYAKEALRQQEIPEALVQLTISYIA